MSGRQWGVPTAAYAEDPMAIVIFSTYGQYSYVAFWVTGRRGRAPPNAWDDTGATVKP